MQSKNLRSEGTMTASMNQSFGQSSNNPFGQSSNNPNNDPFVAKPSVSSSPFGSQTGSSIFGGTSTSVFGTQASSPVFDASSAPAFVSSMPASSRFRSTTQSSSTESSFLKPKPATSSSFSFGSSSAFSQSTSAFGSNPFGATSTTVGVQSSPSGCRCHGFCQPCFGGQQRGGTRVTPYAQTPETYTSSGTKPAGKLESISAMPTYKEKCHEELRWEDYQLGDKGGPNPAAQSSSGTGFNMNNTQQSNPFASASFGQSSANTFSFTAPTTPVAPKTSTGFWSSTPSHGSLPFAKASFFGSIPSSAPSAYGSTPACGSTTFDSLFGAQAKGTTSLFGTGLNFASTQSSPLNQSTTPTLAKTSSLFGSTSTPAFGSTSTPASGATSMPAFGSTSTPAFGATSTPAFGSTSTPASGATSTSAFGSTSTPAFGATCTPAFGSTSSPASGATSTPAFGSTSTPAFGSTSTPAFSSTSTPAFGATSTPAFGSTSTPAFGSTSTPAFGSSSPAFGASSTPDIVASSTPAFGASSTSPFGASSTPEFGASSTPAFGASSTSPFGVSSTSPFGASSTPAFGASSTPEFGASSTSPFGASSTTTFGSSPASAFYATCSSFSSSSSPAFCQSTSTFGRSSPSGATSTAFGAQSSSFGGQTTTPTCCSPRFGQPYFGDQQHRGTRVIPYAETPEADSDSYAGKLKSISAMHAYKEKSHGELRWEDYQRGDKGGTSSNFGRVVDKRAPMKISCALTSRHLSKTCPKNESPKFSFISNEEKTTSTTPAFGQPSFEVPQRGLTRVIPYGPTTVTEYEYGSQFAGNMESISAMLAYKEQSHEELRWADYQVGDEGGPILMLNLFVEWSLM